MSQQMAMQQVQFDRAAQEATVFGLGMLRMRPGLVAWVDEIRNQQRDNATLARIPPFRVGTSVHVPKGEAYLMPLRRHQEHYRTVQIPSEVMENTDQWVWTHPRNEYFGLGLDVLEPGLRELYNGIISNRFRRPRIKKVVWKIAQNKLLESTIMSLAFELQHLCKERKIRVDHEYKIEKVTSIDSMHYILKVTQKTYAPAWTAGINPIVDCLYTFLRTPESRVSFTSMQPELVYPGEET